LADYYFLMDRLRFIAVCAVVFSVSVGACLFMEAPADRLTRIFGVFVFPSRPHSSSSVGSARCGTCALDLRRKWPLSVLKFQFRGRLSKVLIFGCKNLNFAPGTDCNRRRCDEELAPAFRVIFRPLLHSSVEGNEGGATSLRARFPVQQTCRRAKFSD
jgi:hypothetical protein